MGARSLNDQKQQKNRDSQAMPPPVLKSIGNEEQKSVKLIDTKNEQVVRNGPS